MQPGDALTALKDLFEFIRWIDFHCYGTDYQERCFDESLIPPSGGRYRKSKRQESLLDEKRREIEALRKN